MPGTRVKRTTRKPSRYASPAARRQSNSPPPRPSRRRRTTSPELQQTEQQPPQAPQPPQAAASASVDQAAIESNVTRSVIRELMDMGILPTAASTAPPTILTPSDPIHTAPIASTSSEPAHNRPEQAVDIEQLNQSKSPIEACDLPSFRPASLPLGATLSPKLKSKIWAGEFVELTALGSSAPDPPMSITVDNGSAKHTVAISSSSKTATINNIYHWTDLFHTYAAVYTERYPDQGPHLFKYCSIVRSMSHKCSLQWWLFYDNQFRRLKAQDSTMTWEHPHQELYLHCLTQSVGTRPVGPFRGGPYAKKQNPRTQQQVRRGPLGACWNQMFNGKCEYRGCRFRHDSTNNANKPQSSPQSDLNQSLPRRHNTQPKSSPLSGQVPRQTPSAK